MYKWCQGTSGSVRVLCSLVWLECNVRWMMFLRDTGIANSTDLIFLFDLWKPYTKGLERWSKHQKDIWPVSLCLLMDRRGKCKPDVWVGRDTSGNFWIYHCSGNGLTQWLTYLEVRSWSQSSTCREGVTGELEHSCFGPILFSKFITNLNKKAQTFYFIYFLLAH